MSMFSIIVPKRVTDAAVEIQLGNRLVPGMLSGNCDAWNFQSSSDYFLGLFPFGELSSVGNCSSAAGQSAREQFQQAVGRKMAELLSAL